MKRMILAAAAAALALACCGSAESSEGSAIETTAPAQQAHTELVIRKSDITETAKFYPITVDGTDMEVLAVKDSKGGIRTAFNTCQSCYTSGNGRYELEGTDLVCQNCGFHFTADQIGEGKNGGCSPWAIGADERTDTADAVTIPYDLLVSSKNIFAEWK